MNGGCLYQGAPFGVDRADQEPGQQGDRVGVGGSVPPVQNYRLAAEKDVFSGGAPLTSNTARKVVQSFKRAGPTTNEQRLLSRALYAIRIVLKRLLAIWATVGGQMDRLFRNSPQATTLKMDTPTAFASMPRVSPSWESQ